VNKPNSGLWGTSCELSTEKQRKKGANWPTGSVNAVQNSESGREGGGALLWEPDLAAAFDFGGTYGIRKKMGKEYFGHHIEQKFGKKKKRSISKG